MPPLCIAVVCRDTKYCLEDGCAATENIVIAGTALGLGSCWIADDKKPYCRRVLDLLRVPGGYRLVSLISLGWQACAEQRRTKGPLGEVLHWNHF